MRFLFSLIVAALFLWFATMVPLGKRTLWGHLRAIYGTQEVKDLTDGTEQEARKVAEHLLHPDGGVPDLARHHHER